MADIIDQHILMLAPKEWNGREFLPCSLPPTLRNDQVFNPNAAARVLVGPEAISPAAIRPLRWFRGGIHDDSVLDSNPSFDPQGQFGGGRQCQQPRNTSIPRHALNGRQRIEDGRPSSPARNCSATEIEIAASRFRSRNLPAVISG